MSNKVNLGWLQDAAGERIAPKTFMTQVLSEDGKTLDKVLENLPSTPTESEKGVGQKGEGENSAVFNNYSSHATAENTSAFGERTTASAKDAFATGRDTVASGICSHAEGMETQATYSSAHAEGYGTKAEGDCAHAEGYNTTASGYSSHVEGYNTTAIGDYSHVQGRYNLYEGLENMAHIVGNGKVDGSNRSNAHTLDWDGNAEFAGDVIAYGCGGKSLISLAETANDLNNKITTPLTAEVGQLLSVKAIGEDGKPTEWETISIEDIANQVKAIL